MTLIKIAKILDLHNVNYEVTEDNLIIAEDTCAFDGELYLSYINLTDHSLSQLKEWLNY